MDELLDGEEIREAMKNANYSGYSEREVERALEELRERFGLDESDSDDESRAPAREITIEDAVERLKKRECPLCGESVARTHFPDHIHSNHD